MKKAYKYKEQRSRADEQSDIRGRKHFPSPKIAPKPYISAWPWQASVASLLLRALRKVIYPLSASVQNLSVVSIENLPALSQSTEDI